ncbi:MAG: glycosyl hydrolase [Bacteroidota bacterium]
MKLLYTLCFLLFLISSIFAQTPLEQGFDHPPISARPKALWTWLNGNINLSQVTLELEEAKEKGMGGFDIWDVGMLVDPNNVVIDAPPFMDDQSVQAIGHTVREAERLDLELGLVLSSSWNAGGHWIPPKYGAMGLFRSSVEVAGGEVFNDKIPFPELPEMDDKNRHKTLLDIDAETDLPSYYKEVAVLAIPIRKDSTLAERKIVNISHLLQKDGRLKWKAPAGKKKWKITRYVCTPTGQPLAIPSKNSMGRMLDHFSQEAMEFHLEYIISRLQKELGSLENRVLKYLYTDSYEVNSAIWTPDLPQIFATRNSYALETFLPILDGYTIKDEDYSEQFLYDFKKTLSDLIVENHYQFGKEYCAKYGLGFYAEAGGPGAPIHNVPFEDLKALGALTVPRGEFWRDHPQLEQLQIVKGIASAAHLYNQPSVEAEAFTSVWLWQEGPADLKPLADRAMVEGLNRFVYHTFPHTPPEAGSPGWVYNFGTLIHVNNSWWGKSANFHEYLARCSFLLQQGNFVGDVLFYYGDHAPSFVNDLKKVEALPDGYDYDVVNTDVLLNRIVIDSGKLVLPHGQSYEILVLPDEDRIHPDVLQKLIEWQRAGAKIIGSKPSKSYGLGMNKQVDKSALKKLNINDLNLKNFLKNLKIQPDFNYTSSKDSSHISYLHRKTKDADIYFIVNRKNRPETIDASFRMEGKSPEIWNPLSGKRTTDVNYKINENRTNLILELPPFGSLFVLFQKESQQDTVATF